MSTATIPAQQKIVFGEVTPVLRVASVAASINYYTQSLGFHVEFKFPNDVAPLFASVARGKCGIFLSEGDQGHPGSWVWIDGVDVEKVHEEYLAAGAKIRNPPTNYEWALEMQVEDLDGNVLRIGSQPKKNEPIGDWLDMHGVRWRKLSNGAHERVV
ncbi:MAG TPA: glyoxalase superfamily protein [Terracidiphilus sp.]|nr:glyoxalase superfamily protein [Terracidiphilus sp.]